MPKVAGAEVQIYLRDCCDRAIQGLDLVEVYRELTSGLMDVYVSAISNKTNEIMKILAAVLGVMLAIAGGMVFFFYRLGWFGDLPSTRQKTKLKK